MLKEGVSVLFCGCLWTSLVKGTDFDGAWGDLLENLDDLFDCEPETRTDVFSVSVLFPLLL